MLSDKTNTICVRNYVEERCIGDSVIDTYRPARSTSVRLSKDRLSELKSLSFTATEIAGIIGTSVRTINCRISEYGLRVHIPRYTDISEVEMRRFWKMQMNFLTMAQD